MGVHGRMCRDLLAQWEGPPVLYVRPRLDGYGSFDFHEVEYFVEEGYRAMKESLQQEPTVTRTS